MSFLKNLFPPNILHNFIAGKHFPQARRFIFIQTSLFPTRTHNFPTLPLSTSHKFAPGANLCFLRDVT